MNIASTAHLSGTVRASQSTARERIGRKAVHAALAHLSLGHLDLVEPDGVEHRFGGSANSGSSAPRLRHSPPHARLVMNRPGLYSAVLESGSIGAAEAYIDGVWDSPDLVALIELLALNSGSRAQLTGPLARLSSVAESLRTIALRNTRSGSRRNIVAHYDLSDEFFALFLDPTMTYSAAIFERPGMTLEQAQIEKIDRACRKLMLTPADHLVEIGSGWGAMAIHAAREYGCRVTTTTISENQFNTASRRIREAGMAGRVSVVKADYRDLPVIFPAGFDKLVSIEMIEAVGHEFLPTYFNVCSSLLKPHGVGVIQAITVPDDRYDKARAQVDFLKKYIFPGSCLLSVRAMLSAMARTDLRLWHLEDIGPHYATTLRCWSEAFEARLEDVRALGFDDRFIRMWRYYLAYCEGAFRARSVGDVQMTLVKPLALAPAFDAPITSGPAAAGPHHSPTR